MLPGVGMLDGYSSGTLKEETQYSVEKRAHILDSD